MQRLDMGLQTDSWTGWQESFQHGTEIRLEDAPGNATLGTEKIEDVGFKPGQTSRDCDGIEYVVQGVLDVIPARARNVGHHIVDVAVSPE
ncbi:MAG: hypothetical protein VR78_18755 [Hoeflea sp. BRH_c9]|nr:MAG: hypothetical protein VR78_18755 [Hoeflea sp. BRH_c9]